MWWGKYTGKSENELECWLLVPIHLLFKVGGLSVAWNLATNAKLAGPTSFRDLLIFVPHFCIVEISGLSSRTELFTLVPGIRTWVSAYVRPVLS